MRSAARPGAHDARTSSAGLVACFIERENKGLSWLESFFLRTIFQNSTKSFPFGVLGWSRRRERAIKLMNGRLMDFILPLRRKTREMHIRVFYVSRVWESYLWQMETLACTFPCRSDHSGSFINSSCSGAIYLLSLFIYWVRDKRTGTLHMQGCNASVQRHYNINLKLYTNI